MEENDKKIIEKIIEKLKNKSKNIPSNFYKKIKHTFYKNNKLFQIEIPYIIYLDLINQKISNLNNKLIYNMVLNLRKEYNMKDIVDIFELYINYENGVFHIKLGPKHDGITFNFNSLENILAFSNIIENLMKRKNFLIISLTKKPINQQLLHSNMIFVEKIGKLLIFNYYEPHGSIEFSRDIFINKFFEKLENVNSNFYLVRNSIYPGIQKITEDNLGLCIIFSHLWLYIVLNICFYNIKNKTYKTSNFWINNLEKYYVEDLQENNKILYKIAICFGIELINEWLQNLSKKNIYLFLEQLNLDFSQEIEIKEVKERGIDYEEKNENYTKKDFEKAREESSEITYEDWENKREKEIQEYKFIEEKIKNNIQENWKFFLKNRGYRIENGKIKLGKLMGENCNEDNDCFFKKCKIDKKENYCV